MDINDIFTELLQIAVGNRNKISRCLSEDEWEEIYTMARSQALVGVVFYAMKHLSADQLPCGKTVRRWGAKGLRLEDKNKRVTEESIEVTRKFRRAGFYSCILKGQSNICYYPDGLKNLRSPGDIDIWARPNDRIKARFANYKKPWIERWMLPDDFGIIGRFVKAISHHMDDIVYHHFHCNILPKNTVELHVTPSFFMNPFKNARLQHLYNDQWKIIENDNQRPPEIGFYHLPTGLNLVFLISHFYRHLILEGVGMRQLLDIYFVLMSLYAENSNNYEALSSQHGEDKLNTQLSSPSEVMKEIENLGMKKVTSAIMWVFKEKLAMDDKYLLCKPSKKYGIHLMEEMVNGGNFGHDSMEANEMYSGETSAIRFWRSCKYGMRLLRFYPGEALWVPFNNAKQSIIKNYYRRHPV